ncbi:MAG: hypothetical protein Q4E61_01085, partial [Alphaproteobacteria bacterium]|nr:hypothetical protein [Alphaproteobacteria bacterium]
MNKFTKLILSGTLLAVPSYGTTSTTTIDADIDYTNGGTLNINVDTTLNANHTITLGEAAIG